MTKDAPAKKDPPPEAQKAAARLMAVQAIYQSFTDDKGIRLIADEFLSYRTGVDADGEAMVMPDRELFLKVTQGVKQREADLSGLIAGSRGESKKPLDSLLRAIVLCGAYELLAHREIDAPIIINDYLNVTHAFYEGKESSLINGLLDSIAKAARA